MPKFSTFLLLLAACPGFNHPPLKTWLLFSLLASSSTLALSDNEGTTWTPSLNAVGGSTTHPYVLKAKPGELWPGNMEAHDSGGNDPRARHIKVTVQTILDRATPTTP